MTATATTTTTTPDQTPRRSCHAALDQLTGARDDLDALAGLLNEHGTDKERGAYLSALDGLHEARRAMLDTSVAIEVAAAAPRLRQVDDRDAPTRVALEHLNELDAVLAVLADYEPTNAHLCAWAAEAADLSGQVRSKLVAMWVKEMEP
jgi:hypothetical protein